MEIKVQLPNHVKIEGLTQKPEVQNGEEEKAEGSGDSTEATETTEA